MNAISLSHTVLLGDVIHLHELEGGPKAAEEDGHAGAGTEKGLTLRTVDLEFTVSARALKGSMISFSGLLPSAAIDQPPASATLRVSTVIDEKSGAAFPCSAWALKEVVYGGVVDRDLGGVFGASIGARVPASVVGSGADLEFGSELWPP